MAVLLSAAMIFALASCGDDEEGQAGKDDAASGGAQSLLAAQVDVRGTWTLSNGGYSYLLTFYDDGTMEFLKNQDGVGIEALYHGKWSVVVDEVTVELSDSLTESEFTSVMTVSRSDPSMTLTAILGEPLIRDYGINQPMVFTLSAQQ